VHTYSVDIYVPIFYSFFNIFLDSRSICSHVQKCISETVPKKKRQNCCQLVISEQTKRKYVYPPSNEVQIMALYSSYISFFLVLGRQNWVILDRHLFTELKSDRCIFMLIKATLSLQSYRVAFTRNHDPFRVPQRHKTSLQKKAQNMMNLIL
jgi:hypothetical protein